MARAATTTDAFNAIAEPRRREILDALAGRELSVSELVSELPMDQPTVSKHLRVLRAVELVRVREDGRRRLYRIDGRPLEQVHRWVSAFEQTWSERFDALDGVLEELKAGEEPADDKGGSR